MTRATRRLRRPLQLGALPLVLLLATTGTLQLALGLLLIWQALQDPQPHRWRSFAALALLAAGVSGGLTAKRSGMGLKHSKPIWRAYVRWTLSGWVFCYAACLTMTSDEVPYLFLLGAALWQLLAQVIVVWRHDRLQRWLQATGVRVLGWAAYGLLMGCLSTELGLRVYALLAKDAAGARAVVERLKFAPGSRLQGKQVNTSGYWDDEFEPAPDPQVFRVAALGDDLMLAGCPQTNFLAQIERASQQLEIYNFGVPQAGPREYLAQLNAEVAAYHPDLVLIFVNLPGIANQGEQHLGIFHPRHLHVVRRTTDLLGQESQGARLFALARSLDSAAHLKQCTRAMNLCQIPVCESARQRWRDLFGWLDVLIERCRAMRLSPGLVLVPGEFQVDQDFCRVVCRRGGYGAEEIDVALPQRRLLTYAEHRNVPCIDLLPHLRACQQATFCSNDFLFNERGNAIAAQVVGSWLQAQCPDTLLAAAD